MPNGIASKKNFLFDLDGTLVDSNPYHGLAFREVLSRFAPEHLAGFDYEAVKGRPTRDVFEQFGLGDQEQIAVLTAEKQNAYASAISKNGLPLIAGARELLDLLSTLGKRIFVVSAGSRASVEEALRAARIRSYFEGITTSDDVARSKPDPEIYRKCMESYDLAVGDCVAIEDSESGIAASVDAGIDSVMVNSTTPAPGACKTFRTLSDFCLFMIDGLRMARSA
jgi:HAD superfamily hydrolase (TIGR01509 family)